MSETVESNISFTKCVKSQIEGNMKKDGGFDLSRRATLIKSLHLYHFISLAFVTVSIYKIYLTPVK